MRFPTLKMSFCLKTSHRVFCLGNVYFYKPQQLPSYFQYWSICQFAQGAVSSLSLSRQIVCLRSQPETQPSLASENVKAQHTSSRGIAAESLLASWLEGSWAALSTLQVWHEHQHLTAWLWSGILFRNVLMVSSSCLSCTPLEQGLGFNSPAGDIGCLEGKPLLWLVLWVADGQSAMGLVYSPCCKECGGFGEGGESTIGTISLSHL